VITIRLDRGALYGLVAVVALVAALAGGIYLGRHTTTPPSAPVITSEVGVQAPGAAQNPAAGQPVATLDLSQPTPDPTLAALPRISVEEAAALLGQPNVEFVDARPLSSFESGHIKGAISLPVGDVVTRLSEVPRDKVLIIYCA
jgi:hypothetical protein